MRARFLRSCPCFGAMSHHSMWLFTAAFWWLPDESRAHVNIVRSEPKTKSFRAHLMEKGKPVEASLAWVVACVCACVCVCVQLPWFQFALRSMMGTSGKVSVAGPSTIPYAAADMG
eukprot:gb/GFBE01007069.1/.p1 GENE.gb/GFBE01007069.1/~~gb/GFBE01007069.1/.p1  ORF type:complete len:116 (+),score=13.00 gb/GFBE01007069.1/:1-348(+)